MAGHTDSDDAAEIFWPGYVDAVTNLAINLLFVIAVMSIVVLAVTMALRDAPNPSSTESPDQRKDKPPVAEKSAVEELRQKKETAEKRVADLTVAVAQLQTQLEKAQKQAASAQARNESAKRETGTEDNARIETVTASKKPPAEPVPNATKSMTSGVLVLFGKDSVGLDDNEAGNLIRKMGEYAPVKQARWHVEVVVPKGFSEALRLGYYRVNAVRNVLLQNGVAAASIEMRVIESEQSGADNSRVFVRPAR